MSRREPNPVKPEVKAYQERFIKTPQEKAEIKRLKSEHKKYLKAKAREAYER